MGEVAEMMLDGTLCEACGEYIHDGEPEGIPRYCSEECENERGLKMEEIKNKSQINVLHSKLISCNIKCNIWKNSRIYFSSAKDIKAWIEMDEPESIDFEKIYDGCSLKVFSNANQSKKWLINRAKQVKFHFMNLLLENGIVEVKGEICKSWEEVIL